jgi:adenylate cyclase
MRQLAAILFADMSGYTALMQENEQLARAKKKAPEGSAGR